MKKIYFLLSYLIVFSFSGFAQTGSTTNNLWPNSVCIDGATASLGSVNFTQGANFTQGCEVSSVSVRIDWAKTDGVCPSANGGGLSYHEETSFTLQAPGLTQPLAIPGTWTGNVSIANSVITTFTTGSAIPPGPGTPVSGTFGSNPNNMGNFVGTSAIGTWNVTATDAANSDPLVVGYMNLTVTTTPDVTNPVFSNAPGNFNVNTDPNNCTAVVTWPAISATDLCGIQSVVQTAGLPSGSAFPIGVTTNTFRATDNYGRISDHTFTVTVSDAQPPVLSCPADIQVNAPAGNCSANVTYTTPVGTDNCPGTSTSQLAGLASGATFPIGSTAVSFRATDAAGNITNCNFTVEVLDIEDPQINCPNNISELSTLSNCGSVINYATPVGTDNCPGVSTVITAGFPSGSPFPEGTTTVTYLTIDASGNQNDCSFTVTIDPVPNGDMSIPPASVCQGETTEITFNFTSGTGPYNISITDGVSVFNVNGVETGDTYTVTPPTTVTYSYVSIQDASGCVRTSGFDGTASVVVTPIPIVSFTGLDAVYCETDADVTLTGNQNGGLFSGTGVTDLGGGSATFSPLAAGPTGPYSITYEFTDINNCTDSDVQQVFVDDQPVANAGTGGSECDLDFTFNAVPSVGVGTWTTISGPGLPFFSNINSATSIVQVSAPGTYVFRWTEVNGECSDWDEITVVFQEIPVANAGFGGGECDLDFVLGATPSVGVGTWTATGPGSANYSPSANDPNATVTVDAYGTYVFTWTEDNNGCTDDASITVTFDELPVANAGAGGDECDLGFTFSGTTTVGLGVWTAVGPGAATFNAPNSPTSNVTVSNYGTYTFTWTVTNGNCVSVDQVSVNFYEQPVADAGSGGDECDLDFTFSAESSVGSGQWTYTGPGVAVFADDADPNTDVAVDTYGPYNFTWTETNGTCSDSESILVNFYEQPSADAGTGGDECDLDFSLTGTASVGVGLWTASGPGVATFVNDLSASTDVTVSTYGTYVFTWTEISGTCTDAASVTVNFYEQPVAVAGQGGSECDLDFLLQASPSVGSGQWSLSNGPGNATFNNSSSPIALVTVDTYGVYEFEWTETNGTCVDSRTTTVSFFEQPVANAGVGGEVCVLDFGLSAVPSVGFGLWTASGPGTATFTDDTDANATVTVSQSGSYTFTWTETNGSCSDDASVQVSFFDQPVADAGTAVDQCDLNFTFNGVASFGTGTWTYTGPGVAFFTNPNSATASVSVDTYGSYDFTWTEVNGVCSDAASITVNFYQQPIANAGQGGSECDLDFELDATPSVGVGVWIYSGPGTAVFSPSDADPDAVVTVDATGQYTFTWTEDNNGCIDSEDVVVDFNPLPTVSFSGLAATYCIDQTTAVPLTGSPAGGTFSGLGISGNSFVPSIAGVGTIFITYTYTDGNGCTNSQQQTVDVNGLPSVSFTGLSAAYCEDDANAYTLVGVPAGGTFSGLGISGDDFIPSNAGDGSWTIEYTYTDPFGCTNFDEQQVTVNQLPVVSFTGLALSYCENASSANLVGSPAGGVFSGTGIIGSQFSPVAAGVGVHSIDYTYTDGNGCTNVSTQQVTINEVPLPVISPSGVSEICDGESLLLDAGAGYSIYNWSNNTSGQTTLVSQAGTYNVIVITAAGCAGTSAPVQVVVNQPPTVDLGNDTTICTAQSLTIDAGNSGSTFSWSTFEITQSITVTTTGAYTVQVTDGNGCTGTDNIAVTVSDLLDPVIVANGPLSFCDGENVTLDAGAGYDTYLWGTGETTQSITVSTSGVVEVQVWDEFGCAGSDDAIVSVLQLPNAVINPAGPISICEGDTVILSATNNFASYSWNPGNESSSTIQVYESGTFEVTVEDPNNGCESTSAPVQVIVNTVIAPFIVPSGDTEFCQGESVSLSVEPGPYTSILWTSGSTTPSIVVTQTGDYGVTVIDANGCLDSTLAGSPIFIEVWDPQPIAQQQGDSVVVTNGPFNSYQWYLNGAPVPGATSSVYEPAVSGNYLCEVTDENGCIGTSFNVEFTFTGIVDLESIYHIEVYPNPTDASVFVNIVFDTQLDAVFELRDMTGRSVMNDKSLFNVSSTIQEFDLTNVSAGMYYMNIRTAAGLLVKPIIRR